MFKEIPYPNILNILQFFILPHGCPAHLTILQSSARRVCQALYNNLYLIFRNCFIQAFNADFSCSAIVLVEKVALVVILVNIAPN